MYYYKSVKSTFCHILGVILLLILQTCARESLNDSNDQTESNQTENHQVKIRAVFINCETYEKGAYDSEMVRFQRQELYKHNALRECTKKLVLTVKMASEPDQNPGDEYIPIDHVFEGASRKRVRLLNPYILRLRRESPLQAYKLRRIDTVSGRLTKSNTGKFNKKKKQRNVVELSEVDEWSQALGSAASVSTLDHAGPARPSYSVRSSPNDFILRNYTDIDGETQVSKYDGFELLSDSPTPEHIANRYSQYENFTPMGIFWQRKKRRSQLPNQRRDSRIDNTEEPRLNDVHKIDEDRTRHSFKSQTSKNKVNLNSNGDKDRSIHKTSYNKMHSDWNNNLESNGREFALYEIGMPILWYTVHLQLYEKLSTPEGKTVWNDLTKGILASVSSTQPEWECQDVHLRYRPTERLARDDFSLPMTTLCLLEPIHYENISMSDDETSPSSCNNTEFIVVPLEDVVGLNDRNKEDKRDHSNVTSTSGQIEKRSPRRVEVHVSRALFGGSESFNVSVAGADRYLTLPHRSRRPHRAQIDLEIRADDNQLVRVGSSGRIATIVADNTRRTRTILTLQVTNTGLASARFRAMARDCGPELSGLLNEEGSDATVTGPMLLPPQHTRRLRLDLPIEIPVDIAQCSVALVNDQDESVAVRELVIKKGDRCFCVWHCDCVCLSEDPKLICREMMLSRQAAAGLAVRERPRHARSACYPDVLVVNITVVMIGVLATLLLLGVMKACLGLECRCVGSWGLPWMLSLPRKMERYHESKLRDRTVQYDSEGWPVHPDTKKRNVRLISKSMEFILNIVFFVTIPCLLLCDGLKAIIRQFRNCSNKITKVPNEDIKECFSSNDIQNLERYMRRRKPAGLRRWMTPHAEGISTDIWQKGLTHASEPMSETMRPLLSQHVCKSDEVQSCADSEQDDTKYVLTQMHKSRESLAKSQRKLNDFELSSARIQQERGTVPNTTGTGAR